jgi:hypothetical protein
MQCNSQIVSLMKTHLRGMIKIDKRRDCLCHEPGGLYSKQSILSLGDLTPLCEGFAAFC